MTKIPHIQIERNNHENRVFPKWITANIILTEFVESHVGVYITRNEFNSGALAVYFTNPNEDEWAGLIPEEDRQKFAGIVIDWTSIIHQVINSDEILKLFLHQNLSHSLELDLKNMLEKELTALSFMGVDYKGLLLYMLGVR